MEGVINMGLKSVSIFYQKSKSNRPLIFTSFLFDFCELSVFLFDFGHFS
jgi:hypothetical protein